MTLKPYFKDQGGPPPLKAACGRTVRLEEVDALGIVWHGRYAGYLEDGREEMGRRHGLGYLDFQAAGALLPIRSLHVDYLQPLRYLENFTVECFLHWHEGARLNMEYRLLAAGRGLVTRAYSIQMMVDLSGELLLEAPLFFKNFQRRWLAGEVGR